MLGAVLLFAAGCKRDTAEEPRPEDASPSRSVTDALGRRVQVRRPAERAVSLAPNLTEIVFAAGAGPHLVGVTTADDFPSAARALPQVQAYPQIDFEAIAALQPDLVLATDQVNAPRDAATLTDVLGAPTYFFSFASLGDIFDAVETTGRLLGTSRQATRAADSLRHVTEQLRRTTTRAIERGEAERPLVLFLIGDETLFTFSEGSYVHELIRIAGGRSATADLATDAPLSEEFVLDAQPDVIVGAFGEDYEPERLARLHPAWRGVVPALQDGRVYSVPAPFFLRPGPRVAAGARQLAQRLHPALFDTSAATPASRRPSGPEAR